MSTLPQSQPPSAFADIVTAYLAALRESAAFTDPNMNAAAVARRREAMSVEANRVLRSRLDALPVPSDDPRDTVLDGLRATTADEVAVQGREREKVEALLKAGKTLGQLISEANAVRVAAILDALEVMPVVLDSAQPAIVISEVHALAFDRLAKIEHAEALTGSIALHEWEIAHARHNLLNSIVHGAVSLGELTNLRRVDPESYDNISDLHAARELIATAARATRRADEAATAS